MSTTDREVAASSTGTSPAAGRHFIGGEWTPSVNGGTYANHNPFTGAVYSTAAAGDAQDARLAVDSAHAAFGSWSGALPAERAAVMLRAAEVLRSRTREIRRALAAETGCGHHWAQRQLEFCHALLHRCAGLPYATTGQLLPSDVPGTRAMAVRRPLGVIAAMAPWNASLTLAGRAITSPLALGNTVVLKPSEEAPVTGGTLWAEIFAEAGLPDGVLNVVTHAPGEAKTVGDVLISDPRVRCISFTGSTATGRRLAETAGRHLKRIIPQLSGSNPLIILADADLPRAVDAAIFGSFVHQGQVCMSASRIYVENAVADEFMKLFAEKAAALPMGDPDDPATVIGPVINEWALAVLTRRVHEAVDLGARVLAGGTPAPPCYPATVLADVPPDAELAVEETFGPVVIVEPVESPQEAVTRANASAFGLSAAILTADVYRGMELAGRLEAGMVHINDQPVNDEPHMPFGGVKDSGWGRFGTTFAVDEFTQLQWRTLRDAPPDLPL